MYNGYMMGIQWVYNGYTMGYIMAIMAMMDIFDI